MSWHLFFLTPCAKVLAREGRGKKVGGRGREGTRKETTLISARLPLAVPHSLHLILTKTPKVNITSYHTPILFILFYQPGHTAYARSQFPDQGSNPPSLHSRSLTLGLPGTALSHIHFKDENQFSNTHSLYRGRTQSWAQSHRPGAAWAPPSTASGPGSPRWASILALTLSQPGRDLRVQEVSMMMDSTLQSTPFCSPGTDPRQCHTQTSTWYTQVARNVQRRLRTCFPALFPPLWNCPRSYSSPACSCKTPVMQHGGSRTGGEDRSLTHHVSGLRHP